MSEKESEEQVSAPKKTTRRGRPPKKKVAGNKAPAPPLPCVPRDELGVADWKDIIPKKYYDLSGDWCAVNGIVKSELSREEIEEKLDEVGDEAKIITLAGFKYAAKVRGVKSITPRIIRDGVEGYATVETTLEFYPMDGEPEKAVGLANASDKNTSYPFSMYLEAMAENRAFIRAVRTGLRIDIVGYEEITGRMSGGSGADPSTGLGDDGGTLSPQDSLKSIVNEKGKTLGDLVEYLNKHGVDISTYKDFDQIPGDICFEILGIIK